MRSPRRRATLLLCALGLAIAVSPASARPVHKSAQAQRAATNANDVRSPDYKPFPLADEQSSVGKVANARGKSRRSKPHAHDAFGGYTTNSLVSEARKYIGTNPTGRSSLWCGAFMDLVLKRTGHPGGGNLASAYANYGTRVSGPQVGAIAVMRRGGGGHVGVVSGIDPNGNPIIISGNHNRTTAESVYPRSRITAYVVPGG